MPMTKQERDDLRDQLNSRLCCERLEFDLGIDPAQLRELLDGVERLLAWLEKYMRYPGQGTPYDSGFRKACGFALAEYNAGSSDTEAR